MKKTLTAFLAIVVLTWGWNLLSANTQPSSPSLWAWRQQGLYLSGLAAIALMSLSMLLATRPVWLESALGGMDRIYRLHKWAGILAACMALTHWFVEMSDGLIKTLIGRAGRLPAEKFTGFLELLRELAEDVGEWAIYGLLAMLALSLWKRFPYHNWRVLHRTMPLLYLMLAFHAALLTPPAYWGQPVGALLATLLTVGSFSALLAVFGLLGRSRQVNGKIVALGQNTREIIQVTCHLDAPWSGHQAGQFAFVTFDAAEGAHPFTLACADHGDHRITLHIKALGDYTQGLAQRLQVGQTVKIEGPYGRFNFARHDKHAHQLWIAGGIGITPFLAWLDFLQHHPEKAPAAEFHYFASNRDGDPFISQLETLCANLPSIQLHLHGSRQGQGATPQILAQRSPEAPRAEVWFCGPQGLAKALRDELKSAWAGRLVFHQEAFEMR